LTFSINNAGGLFSEESASVEGLEIHYAVNYLAHVYLTLLLMDVLVENHARIVNVSSQAHFFAVTADWNKIKPNAYQTWILYGKHSSD
jgi:NAD(P)-dependent dehydrogenase (short-subunit alcohol dehydrogenase family)